MKYSQETTDNKIIIRSFVNMKLNELKLNKTICAFYNYHVDLDYHIFNWTIDKN